MNKFLYQVEKAIVFIESCKVAGDECRQYTSCKHFLHDLLVRTLSRMRVRIITVVSFRFSFEVLYNMHFTEVNTLT